MILSPHEIAFYAGKHWSGEDLVIAVAVALAESGGDTNAMGRSLTGTNLGQRDHGLWQISGRWNGKKLQATPNWRDPATNAALARAVFDEFKNRGGWTAWSVYTSGSYEKYLPDARVGVASPWPVVVE